MTVASTINVGALNTRLGHLDRCVQEAPEGAYERAKELHKIIGNTCDTLIQNLRAAGFKADNCDLIRRVEAVIYGYVLDSNPDDTNLIVAEGFGEHVDGPARERVLANCHRDMAFLRSMGMAPPASAEQGLVVGSDGEFPLFVEPRGSQN